MFNKLPVGHPSPVIDEPERDYAVEARMILQGLTGLLVEKKHLEALDEFYQCKLIRMANELDILKHKALSD